MKSIQIALIAITISLTLADPIPGCLEVYKGRCQQCYRRKPDAATKGCGPLLPDSDPCSLYGSTTNYKLAFCEVCKTGFKLVFDQNNIYKRKCVKGSIKSCDNEVELRPGVDVCTGCVDQKYYSIDDNKCFTPAAGKPIVKNCLWGGFYDEGTPVCNRSSLGTLWITLTPVRRRLLRDA